jgi:phosphate transport system protein
MERFFDENLNQLRINLNRMAELAYANVNSAVKALVTRDMDLATRTLEADEEVDELNKWVDQHVIEHITLCSPVASDVRLLYTTLKGSRDLERSGDEASTIAKRARKIIKSGYSGELFEIPELCRMVSMQINEAMSCFLKGDLKAAREFPSKDKEIDKFYKSIDKKINKRISHGDLSPKDGPALIDLMFIAKSLERVGDHAVNIAMEVVYLITGEDIRYTEESKRS